MNTANHWDKVYASNPIESLGWYEDYPAVSINLIRRCDLDPYDPIIDVGVGASSLIHFLITEGFRNLTALDHSKEALDKLREELRGDQEQYVRFILADICSADWLAEVEEVKLWHDRALLHFLVENSDQRVYMDHLRSLVKKNGYVVMGAFSLQGARQCSGLPVKRYSAQSLSELLGDEFQLEETVDYLYRMPGGDTRPYIYALFRRSF